MARCSSPRPTSGPSRAGRSRCVGGCTATAYYNINRHLNYSNVCALSCKFCEFYRKAGDDKAYTRDLAYIREEVRKAVEAGATEMHSVGGLHPTLPFSYYTDLVSTIRDEAKRLGSELHVKAFTAVEIVHLARIAKVYKGASAPGEEGRAARREGIRWVLTNLKNAGLGSLPGGGAEVFDDRVHDEAYKGKIRSRRLARCPPRRPRAGAQHQRDAALRPHRVSAATDSCTWTCCEERRTRRWRGWDTRARGSTQRSSEAEWRH
jgi:2-iminoacetate synthase ThiH